MITIEGSNLGIREEDVRGKIRIGDVPCELVNYEISVKIECRTGPVDFELVAPVRVGNDAGFTESSVHFHYKDIKLFGLFPKMGPLSGGTKLSIIGKWLNIGSSISAFLDNYECTINMTQTSSSRLTCITSASRKIDYIRSLNVIIDGANRTFSCLDNLTSTLSNNDVFDKEDPNDRDSFYEQGLTRVNKRQNTSDKTSQCSIYNYTSDPKILQIKPLKSFASGGRMLTVHGMNLDSIQKPDLEVFLNEERINKSICVVITKSQMECPSPPINRKFAEYKSRIELLNSVSSISTPTTSETSYKSNFSIERQERQSSLGDMMFTTDSAESSAPSIPWPSSSILQNNIFVDGMKASTTGALTTASLSGSNDISATLKMRESQLTLQISFIMDDVQMVKDLNKHFPSLRSTITYVEDPVFFAFANNIKLYKGDTLVIEGENLNIACDETDVVVTIGQQFCNVTSLALTQLVCTPPEQQPNPTDESGVEVSSHFKPQVAIVNETSLIYFIFFHFQTPQDLPLVVVRVGKTLRFPIGYLKYELLKPYTFSQAIIGVSVGCSIIVALLCVILFVYRRKSTQAEREYKRIQIQMDTLESNVRLECKQAFAELQTDMTDLTADLENSGIPTLDHMNYIMKVFFPGVSDHPILRSKSRLQIPRSNYDAAMLQFEELINSKFFLMTFIETLEAQKSFNIRDK